jgi:hypothetical protein
MSACKCKGEFHVCSPPFDTPRSGEDDVATVRQALNGNRWDADSAEWQFRDARIQPRLAALDRIVAERDYWHELNTIANGERNRATARIDRIESELAALREALEEVAAFDDEVFSTSSHYRIGWQDATRTLNRIAQSALSTPQEPSE